MRRLLAVALLAASGCLPPPRDESPLPDVKADGALDAATDATKTSDGGTSDAASADTVAPTDAATATDAAADASPSAPVAAGCTTDTPCVNLPWPKCKLGKCNLATGQCVAVNDDDDKVCIGDVCNEDPTCQAGVCVGKPPNCDDTNACTVDGCLPGKGCVHWPAVKACDDGNLCTGNDACVSGACKGLEKACDDKDPCVVEYCNTKTGECATNKPEADGKPCTSTEPCMGDGKCEKFKCVAKLLCEDGNPCTEDKCSFGKCVKQQFADGHACNPVGAQPDPCNPGTCKVDLAGASTCTTKLKCDDGKPCTVDTCDKGSCSTKNLEPADAVACDDGNPMSVGEMCGKGVCACGHSGITTCTYDDLNPCTDDKCGSQTGCVSTPNSAKCSDGSACTTADACKDGKCTGTAVACDDKNPCTQDACDPLAGCTHKLQPGAACGGGKQCDAQGVCK